MKSLAELAEEQRKRDRLAFKNAKDANENYYYKDKLRRIKSGEEVPLNINEDEEEE